MSVCDLESANALITRGAVTIGMFDGVHLGHRALLGVLTEEAERIQGQSVILTFDTHPAEVVRPDKVPKFITTNGQRVAALEAAGVDVIVVARFDQAMADMTPREFVEQVLVRWLKAVVVVVGPDFRFGKRRAGDFAQLAEIGAEYGMAAAAIAPVMVDDAPVSSTRIRTLLRHGAVEEAARLLGRPFVLEGLVVKGSGLGRRLGFPTANLALDPNQITPASGVYAADVVALGRVFRGVVSVGSRPTVGGKDVVVEVHIPNFDENLYGKSVRVGFRSRLRDQKKFADLDQLAEQIAKDVDRTLRSLSSPPQQALGDSGLF